jgi:hypothetical protein
MLTQQEKKMTRMTHFIVFHSMWFRLFNEYMQEGDISTPRQHVQDEGGESY